MGYTVESGVHNQLGRSFISLPGFCGYMGYFLGPRVHESVGIDAPDIHPIPGDKEVGGQN
jgi:hypothetical protein